MKDTVSKSWFCVFNNPKEYELNGTYEDILATLQDIWIKDSYTRSCAMTYCLSSDGLEHIHMVLEDDIAMRFSKVKKIFPKIHIEPTKGTKSQAEDYINKVGVFEEKGEVILASLQYGEIKGAQGQRADISSIRLLIEKGLKPQQIFDTDIKYRRWEKIVKEEYYSKRNKDTPFVRELQVEWHCGKTGTGKSYSAVQLIEELGEDNVYFVTDYNTGMFDNYNGQPILVLDEFRGQIPYSLLLSILQGYKQQFHARYSNIYGLWNKVLITSVMPPELVYKKLVSDNVDVDTYAQLKRRINIVIYHYKDDEQFKFLECSGCDYDGLSIFENKLKDETRFIQVNMMDIPFN